MAAHDPAILARLQRVGLGAIPPAHGLATLGQAILTSVAGLESLSVLS